MLPDNSDRPVTSAYSDTGDTPLGKIYRKSPGYEPGLSAFLLLDNGLDAFVARAVLAQATERSIDTQYYLIHRDHVGNLFAHELWKAAERDVRVRILLDDINEGGRDFNIALFDSHPNIEVRIFNPFGRNIRRVWQYVIGFGSQTRRSHNKSFTVDNHATIVGGRNIGDEYFSRNPELEFQDLDVLAVGPVAQQVSASFDDYWNHVLSYPITTLTGERPDTQQIAQLSDSIYLERLKRVFDLVKDFGTSQSPKSTRPLTTYWCPSRPGY